MYSAKDFQIMSFLSQNLTSYESVTWLAPPHSQLDGETPYNMMKKGRAARVYSALYDDIKLLKI